MINTSFSELFDNLRENFLAVLYERVSVIENSHAEEFLESLSKKALV